MLAGEVEPRSRTQMGVSPSQRRESSPSPLERRVSFWTACAVAVSVPPDEPRKSFMKFWDTDAINLTCADDQEKLLSCGLFRLALNVDFTFQVGAFLNRDALRGDVAGNDRRLAQFHPVAGHHIALEFALHHNRFGIDRRLHLAMRPHGQAVVLESDGALDLTIHIKILATRQLALDHNRFTNLRQICGQRSTHEGSPFQGSGILHDHLMGRAGTGRLHALSTIPKGTSMRQEIDEHQRSTNLIRQPTGATDCYTNSQNGLSCQK